MNKQGPIIWQKQMRQMGSISRLPSNMPPLEDELVQRPDSLWERVTKFLSGKQGQKKAGMRISQNGFREDERK